MPVSDNVEHPTVRCLMIYLYLGRVQRSYTPLLSCCDLPVVRLKAVRKVMFTALQLSAKRSYTAVAFSGSATWISCRLKVCHRL